MRDPETPSLIGLDWGTTSCRAYLIGSQGQIIEQKATDNGILSIADGDFETTFETILGLWLSQCDPLPVIASGMITSKNGWVETPYLPLPATADDFAKALRPYVTATGHRLHFVSGVSIEDDAGTPDVMRGEETEILGHMQNDKVGTEGDTRLYIVPGTHSKWVHTEGASLKSFATFMTGEIYAVMKTHSILSRLTADGPFSEIGFDAGVRAGLVDGVSLLHELFGARTLPLFERLTPVEAANYLSGLLIGAEIASGLFGQSDNAKITIIGEADLTARYDRALNMKGVKADRAKQTMGALGHWRIARLAGLLT